MDTANKSKHLEPKAMVINPTPMTSARRNVMQRPYLSVPVSHIGIQ